MTAVGSEASIPRSLKALKAMTGPPHLSPRGRFALHFLPRIPVAGRCNGLKGVDDPTLVKIYADALDTTYEALLERQWTSPVQNGEGPINVFILDAPFPFVGRSGASPGGLVIILRSELEEPTHRACQRRACVEATHEAVHLFTHLHRQLDDEEWAWFHEATAVFIEQFLHPCNHATLSNGYAQCWVNEPEIGLENAGGYHAAWFLKFLVEKHDFKLLRETWHSDPRGTPCQVLDALLRKRKSSLSAMVHAYAVRSHRTGCFDRLVNRRYGDRKYAYVMPLNGLPRQVDNWNDKILPLGCRYYRIGPSPRRRQVEIVINVSNPAHINALQATVHTWAIPLNGHPRRLVKFRHCDPDRLVANACCPSGNTELVLVVSHAGDYSSMSHVQDWQVSYEVTITVS